MNHHRIPLPPIGHRMPSIPLTADVLPGGQLRISTPLARGWSATAANRGQLADAIGQAFIEASVAAYARAHREPYDLDHLTIQVAGDPLAAAPQRRSRTPRTARHKAHNPQSWTRLEDGNWRSPAGRTYGPNTSAVRNVVAKLEHQQAS